MADNVLSYNGYCGSIETSLDDDRLFGQVMFINDLINYEGHTPGELKKAFIEAVDFYLEKCKEEGLEPDKPFSGSFNVRLSPDLHKSACIRAAERGQSLNELVKEAIAFSVGDEKSLITNETHHHSHLHLQRFEFESEQSIERRVVPWKTVPSRRNQEH